MKRHSKLSGMFIVTCDHRHDVRFPGEGATCGEEFRSCSVESVIPKQLEAAGWKSRQVHVNGVRQSQDLCPYHAEQAGLVARRMPEKRTW